MSSTYSSWNSFLQQNINKYSTLNGGSGDDSSSSICIDKFDQSNINDFCSKFSQRLAVDQQSSSMLPYIDRSRLSLSLSANNSGMIVGDHVCCVDEHMPSSSSIDKMRAHDKLKYMDELKLAKCTISSVDLNNVECVKCISLMANNKLSEFNGNTLKDCQHVSFVYNGNLKQIKLPKLMCIDSLKLIHNSSLDNLNMEQLTYANWIGIKRVNSLTCILLPKLERVKTLSICFNEQLQSISIVKLEHCKKVYIEDNPALQSIDLTMLRGCKSIYIKNNANLKTIYLPALEHIQKLVIENCVRLERVDNKSLHCVSELLYIDACPVLTQFQFNSIKWAKHIFAFGLNRLDGFTCTKSQQNELHHLIDANQTICLQ